MSALRVGQRVTVTDLRNGRRHRGIIEGIEPDVSRNILVRYDGGGLVRVNAGFVAGDPPPDASSLIEDVES